MDQPWMIGRAVPEAVGMTRPVRCRFCQRVYDLGTVTVTGRYTDCSMWRTPCCDITADDRGETGWKSIQDYYPLKRVGDVWTEA